MATLRRLDLIFGANLKPLESGVKQVQRIVDNAFASGRNPIAALSERLSSGFTSLAAAAGPAGLAVAGTSAAIVGVAGAATAAATAFAYWEARQVAAISGQIDLADKIGTTQAALAGLELAAKLNGTATDAMTGAVGKLQLVIGQAVRGSEDAQQAFARLGLSYRRLASQDSATAFRRVVAQLQEISNPAARAAAAVEVFGKSAQGITNILGANGDAIGEAMAKAEMFGQTLSGSQTEAVRQAEEALTGMHAAIGGISTQIGADLAPTVTVGATVIGELAMRVKDLWVNLDGAGGAMGSSGFLSRIATLSTLLPGAALPAALGQGVADTIAGMRGAALAVDQANEHLAEARGNADAFGRSLEAVAEAGNQVEEFKTGSATSVFEAFNRQADSMIARLREEADTYGMTRGQIAIYQAEQMGLYGARLGDITAMANQIDHLDRLTEKYEQEAQAAKKLQEEQRRLAEQRKKDAQQIVESTQSPLQSYRDARDKIRKMYEEGLLTKSQAYAANLAEVRKLSSALPKQELSVLRRGSAEAFRDAREQNRQPKQLDELIKRASAQEMYLRQIAEKVGTTGILEGAI